MLSTMKIDSRADDNVTLPMPGECNPTHEIGQHATDPPKVTEPKFQPEADEHHLTKTTAYFVEFCAGSAALSAEVRKAGIRVAPIDHVHNRHRTLATTISLDLADDTSRPLVSDLLHHVGPFAVHFGLPCGTCSRARDKVLPKHLQQTFVAPPPLRDAQHLMGFPHLTGIDLVKVTHSNRLYRNADSAGVLQIGHCSLHREPAAILDLGSSFAVGKRM